MKEKVISLIEKYGLEEMKETILAHLHPCIYLLPQRTEFPELAKSRLGGYPDFPPGWSYPLYNGEPLVFIGQLNLEEIQSLGIANELPGRGILYFFYEAREQSVFGELENRDGWRVLYYDGDLSAVQSVPYPGTDQEYGVLYANHLQMNKGLSLHGDGIKVPDALWDTYYDEFLPAFAEINGSHTWNHQVLGHPNNIQGDVFEEVDYLQGKENGGPYTLLLQVDTDEDNLGIMWGDVGTIYFVLSLEDLKAKRFENALFSYQCC